MRWRGPALLLVLGLLAPAGLGAQPFPAQDLPAELKDWVPWVLDEVPDHVCPVVKGAAVCLWPGRLRLQLTSGGGRFELDAHADRDLALPLPGSVRHWPQDVSLDGRPVPVVEGSAGPSLRLPAGSHRVAGRFVWPALPDSLAVPPQTALVSLTLEGRPVTLPQREEAGLLWLRKARAASTGAEESIRIQVFRKVRDGIPLWVETTLALEVSGKAREVDLAGGLVEGSRPVAVRGGLPARLDRSGRLRVQVRAGRFTISTLGLLEGKPGSLALPATEPPWPEREIWVFEANETERHVRLSGPAGIDPSRTDLPQEWRSLPAFLMEPEQTLSFEEIRRGAPDVSPDQIQLQRQMWLGLSGRELTVRDEFSGTLNGTWRLDLLAPGELGRVSADGVEQLVTAEPDAGRPGVELRRGTLDLVADSRLPREGAQLNAVGWAADVESLAVSLHLPPGWRVLGATGVDALPGSWIARWTLLGFFFVLLVTFGVSHLAGRGWGILALVALGLSYKEPGAPFLIWLSLLGAIAVLGVAGEGRLGSLARLWWWVSVLVLALTLAPFVADQIRTGLFPQVGRGAAGLGFGSLDQTALPAAAPARQGIVGRLEEEAPARDRLATNAPASSPPFESQQLKVRRGKVAPEKGYGYSWNVALEQDPHAVLQTGPGVPSWTWQTFRLHWSGPVRADHRMRLFLIPPALGLLLSLARIGLLAALAARLLRLPGRGPASDGTPLSGSSPAVALCLALTFGSASPALATESPSPPGTEPPTRQTLEELKKRLTRKAPCAPRCVSTSRLELEIRGQSLAFRGVVEAAAKGSWPVPGPAASWVPSQIRVDGRAARGATRLADGFLHVRLEPGVHRVEAVGALPPEDSITIQFRDRPKRATVRAPGWEVTGIRGTGPPDESIQLSRRLAQGTVAAQARGGYSPWLEVTRTLEIGVSWRVVTEVRRVSPPGTPIAVRIPLIHGEALTEGDYETEDGEVLLGLNRDQVRAGWSSTLEPAETLSLEAPEDRPWSEIWRVQCSVVWQCRAEGLPPVAWTSDGFFEPRFHPWPSESVSLHFRHPQGVEGQTLTLDEVQIEATPGSRLEKVVATVKARSSREDSLTLTLPEGVEVQQVTVNGETRPARPEGERLRVSVPAGESATVVRWHRGRGMGVSYSAPRLGLGIPGVNVGIAVNVPENRWLLLSHGPAWGPAVLFWGYLIFALLVALALGQLRWSPLTTAQWALLALGLAQVPLLGACVVVGFFFAMEWRARRPLSTVFSHNALQVLLAFWAIAAMAWLYEAVKTGLVLRPDMQVAGNASSQTLLRWYVDRVAEQTPAAGVVSLPLWAYRIAMFAWALWLAASLVRWAGWAWRSFTERGAWRRRPKATASAGEPAEETREET